MIFVCVSSVKLVRATEWFLSCSVSHRSNVGLASFQYKNQHVDVRGSLRGHLTNVGVLVTCVSSHVQWVWVHTIRECFFQIARNFSTKICNLCKFSPAKETQYVEVPVAMLPMFNHKRTCSCRFPLSSYQPRACTVKTWSSNKSAQILHYWTFISCANFSEWVAWSMKPHVQPVKF